MQVAIQKFALTEYEIRQSKASFYNNGVCGLIGIDSKKIIEDKVQKKVRVFCSPHGNMNDDLRELIKEAGYEYAVTCDSGINNLKGSYDLKRINIWEGKSQSLNGRYSKVNFALYMLGI